MEDDEHEIRSHASPTASDSPDPSFSSPPVGRITVTVASTGPPSYSLTPPASSSSSQQLHKDPNALALALIPVHTSGVGGVGGGSSSNGRSGGGGGREDCWSEAATAVLIDAWGERYLELSRGNLKQKHWKEVAEIVSSREDYGKTPKTDIQCKNRIDTVKKKYKQEKVRIANGGGRSRWVFYDKLDRLIGSTAKIPSVSPGGGSPLGGGGGGLHKIPMGIPMNTRSNLYHQQAKAPPMPKRNTSDSDSESEAAMSEDSGDSLPPPPLSKRPKTEEKQKQKKKTKQDGGDGVGSSSKWKELTRAIMRFGEAYEETENAKLQQVVEMEKERMKFLKEMELQRMQFFVNTQVEISQLKQQQQQQQHGRRLGNTSNDHHNNNNMSTIVNNGNRDLGN
ncbi:unnamed protein product [Cochlearia groenlandica]